MTSVLPSGPPKATLVTFGLRNRCLARFGEPSAPSISPTFRFSFGADGITNEVEAERRHGSYFVSIARPRVRGKADSELTCTSRPGRALPKG